MQNFKGFKAAQAELRCYIRWAKRALDKHIRTYQPITVRTESGVTTWDFLELGKDLHDATMELYVVRRKIQQKKENKK